MSKRRNCGNCEYFTKLKNDHHSGGICEAKDKRVNTDSNKKSKCEDWKGIRYKRNKIKTEFPKL